jgi:hypothetical protein
MSEKENKLKLKFVEVAKIPPAQLGPRNENYDEAINAILQAQGNTISLQIADLSPKQVYAGVHPRVLHYNEDPNRIYDIMLAQRKQETFLQKCPKDSLPKKEVT